MKRLLVLLAMSGLGGCATTDPGDGAGIAYRLPRTDAKITLAVDVKACTPELRVEPSILVEAVAGVRDGVQHVDGRDLASAVAKRATTVAIDRNGVITDVNATTTDQEAVIAGGLVKLAATIAGAGLGLMPGAGPPGLVCSAEAVRASARAAQLATALETRRATLATAGDPAGVQKEVDALAAALAGAQAALHASVSAPVGLGGTKPAGGDVALRGPDFEGYGDLRRLFSLPGGASGPLERELARQFRLTAALRNTPGAEDVARSASPTLRPCRASIAVPAVRSVRIVLTPRGAAFEAPKPTTLDVAASQFDPPARLCLSTAFGENRTVALAFDPFGRTTKLTWSADARLANAVGAAATSAPDAAALINDVRGAALARDKDDAARLAAENALRIARTCRAALDAGAVVCPSR